MRFIIIAALILHTAVTLWSLRDAGFFAPFPPFSEDYVYQIFSDLGAALLISVLFIYASVRQHRKPLGVFYLMLIMIPLVGSFSPLIYLILNPDLLSAKTQRVKVL
jgi:hypothetical protein